VALILFDRCYLAGSTSNAAFNAALPGLLRTEMMPQREHSSALHFHRRMA